MSAGGRSRAAALALLAGVIVVVGAAVIVPAGLYWSKTGSIIRDARMKTLRSEQRENSGIDLKTKRQEWDAFVAAPTSGFLLADDDSAGLAATEERIKRIFSDLGGSTTSVATEVGEGPRAGVRGIAVEVRGTVPRENIGSLLGALESTPAYIVVRKFKATVKSGDRMSVQIGGTAYRLAEGEI